MIDIFLCHTGANKPWVEGLATRLEAETSGDRPISVFFDHWDIDYGENILGRLEAALTTARLVAVVMSPAFTRAEWPRLEWQSRVWQDPTGKRASVLPILLEKFDPVTGDAIDIPLPLRMLKWFDFSDPKRFEKEFAALVQRIRGEPPRRGSAARNSGGRRVAEVGRGTGPVAFIPPDAPDRREERLVSNLLRVHRHPTRVWNDLTAATSVSDVWKSVPRGAHAPFVLNSGRLYSFYRPDDPLNPFRSLLTGSSPCEERPLDWLDDPVRSRWLMWMYNSALREHAFQLGIRTPRIAGQKQTSRQREQYYCPVFNGQPRVFRWAASTRARTLAKLGTRQDGSPLGVHYAARMRFMALGNEAYVLVNPGWLFTEDGMIPLQGRLVGVLSTKYGGKERNKAVLRNVLMWGLLLSAGKSRIELSLGAESLLLDTVPAHTQVGVGVDGDEMPLQRVMAGDGAGEVSWAIRDSPYADSTDTAGNPDATELDELIALEQHGLFDSPIAVELDPEESQPAEAAAYVEERTAVYAGGDQVPMFEGSEVGAPPGPLAEPRSPAPAQLVGRQRLARSRGQSAELANRRSVAAPQDSKREEPCEPELKLPL